MPIAKSDSDAGRHLTLLNPVVEHVCPVCSGGFRARARAKYCSVACRHAAWRARHPGRNAEHVKRYQDRKRQQQAQQEEGA